MVFVIVFVVWRIDSEMVGHRVLVTSPLHPMLITSELDPFLNLVSNKLF
jgi:hypothetical protein